MTGRRTQPRMVNRFSHFRNFEGDGLALAPSSLLDSPACVVSFSFSPLSVFSLSFSLSFFLSFLSGGLGLGSLSIFDDSLVNEEERIVSSVLLNTGGSHFFIVFWRVSCSEIH